MHEETKVTEQIEYLQCDSRKQSGTPENSIDEEEVIKNIEHLKFGFPYSEEALREPDAHEEND